MIDENKLIEDIEDMMSPFLFADEEREWALKDVIEVIENQPKVGEWIPVEERLPENCSSVLCYSILNGVEQGCYNPSTDTWIMFRWGELTGKVTYWQPLPEKPKGETE